MILTINTYDLKNLEQKKKIRGLRVDLRKLGKSLQVVTSSGLPEHEWGPKNRIKDKWEVLCILIPLNIMSLKRDAD